MGIYLRLGSLSSAWVLLAALQGASATAQVQVKVLEDGTKLIYNESATQRARRTAGNLLPVPSANIRRLIDQHARRLGFSPRLVQAVVQVESGYNPKALSRKGAMGLMQLMPATARELRVDDAYDADQNIRGGTTYLGNMLRRYSGDLTLALAAYNAGPTAVDRYRDVPPYRETRNYVRKVLGLYYGTASSRPTPLLQEHARDVTRQRNQDEAKTAASRRRGEKVYVTRDESGHIIVTTSPKSN